MLVDRIISAQWRLRRLGQVEAGIFTYKYYGTLSDTQEMEGMQEANTTMLGHAFVTDANESSFLEALPLRDRDRAQPLQVLARTPTPPGRPPGREHPPTTRCRRRGGLRGFEGRCLRNLALFRKM